MYSNEIVCDILNFIDKNIKIKITINDICDKLNYNRYYIMKIFKRELNISIVDYINIVRVYKSMELINDNNTMLYIALNNGFNSLEYFSEMFKNILGINPTTYKKIINYDRSVSSKDYNLFTTNLANIKELLDKIEVYKRNLKPHNNKILSIFK